MRRLAFHTLLLGATPASGQSIDTILRGAEQRSLQDGCVPAAAEGDITVCGRREGDRFRLPLPRERDQGADGAVAGEPPRGDVQDPFATGCGPFAGRRRCSKREALAHGYGGGRDPLTLLTRAITRAVDPDAEIGPPPPSGRRTE